MRSWSWSPLWLLMSGYPAIRFKCKITARRLAVLFALISLITSYGMIVPVFLNKGAGEQIVLDQVESHSPAGLLVENPTPSFWTSSAPDANPLAFEGSEGPLTWDADICIMGSGITGESDISISWRLADLMLHVVRNRCSLSSITSRRRQCFGNGWTFESRNIGGKGFLYVIQHTFQCPS